MFKTIKYYHIVLGMVTGCLFCKTASAQIISIPQTVTAQHPRIYTSNSEKHQLKIKINGTPWAKAVFERAVNRLKPYMAYYQKDSTWLVSRLQMHWKTHRTDIFTRDNSFIKAEGNAPVPTVRYTGSRDWSTPYSSPAIKDLVPYADPDNGTVYMLKNGKGEWTEPAATGLNIERINENILNLVQDAAFIYWYTGKTEYAAFASSVLITYVKGLYYLNLPIDLKDGKPNNISGLTSFEVIHEGVIIPVTISYDFLYSYLEQKEPGFATKFAAPVFQKWADNITLKGVPNNNWNIFEARFMSYLAMALDNNSAYENGKGTQYYLDIIYNRPMPVQAPLTESLKRFDSNTGIWYEAPGYSMSVSEDLLKIVLLTDRVMNGAAKPIMPFLKKAVAATAQYLMPNKHTVAFGDAHYDRLPNKTMEYMVSWCRKYEEVTDEQYYTNLLKYSQPDDYSRVNASLFDLFFYVTNLQKAQNKDLKDFATPTFYAPNVSWFAQRNGFSSNTGMMISLNASLGNHAHANGISMELYGKGYPLAPDFAAGDSYWQQNHREFYSQFAAHNTVVVNGKSTYGSMRSNQPFELKDYYPALLKKDHFFKNITYTRVAFTEPATQANQLRLLSIIRTSDSTGYYIDIFRSATKNKTDIKNEYLYHNIGQRSWITDADNNAITLKPTNELSADKGDVVGYNYFTDKTAASYNGDFKATFELKDVSPKPIWMNLWMQGQPGREVFSVNSPKSRALRNDVLPPDIAAAKVPTLVVRQKGEAWTRPFVAVIEPSYASEQSISTISSFTAQQENQFFTGLKVINKDKSTQYIFADAEGTETNLYQDYAATAAYAVAGVKQGKLDYLFLGNGKSFFKGSYGLQALDSTVTAALTFEGKTWKLYADKAIQVYLPLPLKSTRAIVETVDETGKKNTYRGKIINGKQAVFSLPVPAYHELKLYLK